MSDAVNHQDWTPVVIRKRYDAKNANEAVQAGGSIQSVKKSMFVGASTVKVAEAGDASEIPKPTIVPGLGTRISQARATLKLSQKDLAQRISVPTQTVSQIEASKLKATNDILQKMERVLNVKLRGDFQSN